MAQISVRVYLVFGNECSTNQSSHRYNLGLAGILYLHRISDNRMGSTPLKNLTMFKKLCGENFFERVILTTTMWSEGASHDSEEMTYIEREEELKRDYWAQMIDRGSVTLRFRRTQASAWSIIDHLIAVNSAKRWMRVQEELAAQRKMLPHTEVGQHLGGPMEELIERQNELLKRLRDELGEAANAGIVEALLSELGKLRMQRDKIRKDMHQSGSSLWSRFFNTFRAMSAFRRNRSP